MEINRFDVVLVRLDPTIGREIKKTRPAIVVSPNEINHNWSPLVVVPLTSKMQDLGFRIGVTFQGTKGQAALDQLKAIDRKRIVKKIGKLSVGDSHAVQEGLLLFFRKES
jgi:mRNA interferase MazF